MKNNHSKFFSNSTLPKAKFYGVGSALYVGLNSLVYWSESGDRPKHPSWAVPEGEGKPHYWWYCLNGNPVPYRAPYDLPLDTKTGADKSDTKNNMSGPKG